MSFELQGLYDITPNKLVPLDPAYPFAWVFGNVLFVQSEGLYTNTPGRSAMIFYSTQSTLPSEAVQLIDGKTIQHKETLGLEFQNIRGDTMPLFLHVVQQLTHFEVSFVIENISFYKNFHRIQNISRNSSTIVFDTVNHRDHDHTFLLDYATNDPFCGKLHVGNVYISLPETDMQRKQLTIKVHESHMNAMFEEHQQEERIESRFPADEPIRLTATRKEFWSRFLFWNLEFYHGIRQNNENEMISGAHNVCIGNNSGTPEGEQNVCVGHGAGVSGKNNVALGNNIVTTPFVGNDNVFLGNNTGCNGSNNIWISTTSSEERNNSIKLGSLVSGNMVSQELFVHGTLTAHAFSDGKLTLTEGNITADHFDGNHFEANVGHIDYLTASVENVDYFAANVANVSDMSANVGNVNYLSANVANVSDMSANVGNINYLSVNVANVSDMSANVGNINYLSVNVANVSDMSANVGNINYLSVNVANVSDMSANVGNVNYLSINKRVSAPEFTDGHLSIMNGDISGVNSLEINGAMMYCDNGKIKFQYEGKTFVLMTE